MLQNVVDMHPKDMGLYTFIIIPSLLRPDFNTSAIQLLRKLRFQLFYVTAFKEVSRNKIWLAVYSQDIRLCDKTLLSLRGHRYLDSYYMNTK